MVSSLIRLVFAVHRPLARLVAVRRAIAELRRMDDSALADLGIGRREIAAYAWGELHRVPQPRPVLRVIEGGRERLSTVRRSAHPRLRPVPAQA